MKYFIDTEFLEGKQDKRFLGIKYGETKPTIDLISIGIVCEDGKNLYLISKDFNLKEAWNRYEIEEGYNSGDIRNIIGDKWQKKVYWIRENVLKPIWEELRNKQYSKRIDFDGNSKDNYFSYNSLKYLIKKYGKSNKQIAEEIVQFIDARWVEEGNISKGFMYPGGTSIKEVKTSNVQFYGYFCDYDWVVFCWLFGKMINLPKGFPMYCIDLKQISDEVLDIMVKEENSKAPLHNTGIPKWKRFINDYDIIKKHPDYPKQTNGHNALADARWNYELYKFLQQL